MLGIIPIKTPATGYYYHWLIRNISGTCTERFEKTMYDAMPEQAVEVLALFNKNPVTELSLFILT